MSNGWMRATVAATSSLVRHLPLFFRSTPRTPLRVLAIIALDTVHALRTSRPLSRQKIGELAMVLDFQACTNAAWDHKQLSNEQYELSWQRLRKSRVYPHVDDYLSRLHRLESQRPHIGGDHRNFAEVRTYRDGVARLSFATIGTIALDTESLDQAMRATQCDPDVETLFRIVQQCQVIDDVLDYEIDLAEGLPSFLTATESLQQALALTAAAVRSYGPAGSAPHAGAFPVRMALGIVTSLASLAVRAARWRYMNTGSYAVAHSQRI